MQKLKPAVLQCFCTGRAAFAVPLWQVFEAEEAGMAEPKRKTGWWVVLAGVLLTTGFVAGQSAVPTRRSPQPEGSARLAHQAPKPLQVPALAPPTTFLQAPGLRAAARVDRTAVLRGTDGQLFVELSLEAVGDADEARPTDFIVVLDHSGSMEGQKLRYAKIAASRLIDKLTPRDRFALVSYDSAADLTFGLAQATEARREAWQQGLSRIHSGTGTNISAGLDLALSQLAHHQDPERVQRVLLLSDGLANEGDISRPGLMRRARRAASLGAVLTAMGIGDDFDQPLMTALAEAGTGNFYYLAKLEVLPTFFDAELHAASRTVASNLAVHFVPGAYAQLIDAAGYPLERSAGEVVFNPGSMFAGQRRSLWLKLAVPTTELTSSHLGSLRLTYTHRGEPQELEINSLPDIACVASNETFEKHVVREVWEAAVAREELAKVEDRLAEAVMNGTSADVDEVVNDYVAANETMANQLHSKVVQESVLVVRRRAEEAKQSQQQDAPQRNVASRRMKASGGFMRRSDAYSADPFAGF